MATIVVLNGKNQGEWYSIGNERALIIGRDDSLLAAIMDRWVSHRHMQIHFEEEDQQYLATDLNSRNGVLVNGQRARPQLPLEDGDCVRIGRTLVAFTVTDIEGYDEGKSYFESAKRKHHDELAEIEGFAAPTLKPEEEQSEQTLVGWMLKPWKKD